MGSSKTNSQLVYLPHSAWDDEEDLLDYFNSILQDMEDLGHRMLSTTYVLGKSDAIVSPYKTEELVRAASMLMHMSEDFYKGIKEAEAPEGIKDNKNEEEEEAKMMRSNGFLSVYHDYLECPDEYVKEKEEEEKRRKQEEEREKKEKEEREKKEKEEEHKRKEEKEKALEEKKKKDEEDRKRRKEEWMKMTAQDKHKYKEDEKKRNMEKRKERKEKEDEERRNQAEERRNQAEEWKRAFDYEEEMESTMEYLKNRMVIEQDFFDGCRRMWEHARGSEIGRCGAFEDKTLLSPMFFTHYTPCTIPSSAAVTGSTLQIYSFRILELKGNLNWPLYVYGLIAARDTVDRNRNILFNRSMFKCQLLTQNDPFLRLSGPSRAIVALDPVDFEVELKLHDGVGWDSQDRPLMNVSNRYDGTDRTILFHSCWCTAELSLQRLATTVQATIVGVRVVEGGWPFKYGGRIACSQSAAEVIESTSMEVVLLDCHGEGMPVGPNGYLQLSRNVVSVELQGELKVVIQAYMESGRIDDHEGHLYFPPKHCQTSTLECFISDFKMEITVAWSRLVRDRMDVLIEGHIGKE
ncbi:hypothetical protein CFC21_020450 [Triticum aestivum]|uniref:DUF6598 domain-containing protein n=3 Tax=Triticum TaxID=4564 RepID=A0A3B6B8U8_WHEAT|nr:uncharacterized protein LOC123038249 [Triticum aestivum]KAF7005325.1 hypothetical protein CFC21_020450 [Triticum aestivum]